MNNEADIVLQRVSLIKIAIDMHLRSYRVVRQIEYRKPQPAQRFAPEAFYRLARKATGPGASGWWSATKRAALGMSRRGACKGWEWKST